MVNWWQGKRDQRPFVAPEQFYRGSLGRSLLCHETDYLRRACADVFGYYSLLFGCIEPFAAVLAESRLRRGILLSTEVQTDGGSGMMARAESHLLPIPGDYVDLVVLPHTLDCAINPQQTLREAERVLIAEGRLLVFGFNPLSPWRFGWRGFRTNSVSMRRLCDWLELLGLQMEWMEYYGFHPVLRNYSASNSWGPLDRVSRRWLPVTGAFYALRAVKRVTTVTRLRRRANHLAGSLLAGGRLVEPTTRNLRRQPK
jgi:SAM-dependent methyltransferase